MSDRYYEDTYLKAKKKFFRDLYKKEENEMDINTTTVSEAIALNPELERVFAEDKEGQAFVQTKEDIGEGAEILDLGATVSAPVDE